MESLRGKGRGIRVFIGYVIILSSLVCLPGVVFSETTADLKNKVNTITEKREGLEKELLGYSDQRTVLADKIKVTEDTIKILEESILRNELELKKQQGYLSEYIKLIYEEEQVSFFEKLFKAKSFSDFVNINEYNNTIRDDFKTSVDLIDGIKDSLEKDRKKLSIDKKILEISRVAYDKQITEKGADLEKLKIEELRIRRLFGERLSKAGSSPYCKNEGKIISAKYPVYSFPVDCGYISQGYGDTEFASIDRAYDGAIHNGVDVGVASGTDIRSIGAGVVYAKGVSPSGGWGNWVMVKHDKVKVKVDTKEVEYEFYSLYAHMISETYLNLGEKVDANTVLGWVGGTPDWAPHLHFSLYISPSGWAPPSVIGTYYDPNEPGNVVDPLDFMDIPISTGGTDWDPDYAHPFK